MLTIHKGAIAVPKEFLDQLAAMKRRKPVPRKAKPFPRFPVPAGAPPLKSVTVKSIVSDDIMSLFGSAHNDRPYDPKEKATAHGSPLGTFAIDPDDEMIAVHNAASRDPHTLKAASIVLPLLRAKKVTPQMIRVMLEEIVKLRSKSSRPDFIEYLRKIPKIGPTRK